MIASVATGSVAVRVAVVARTHPLHRFHEIGLGTRARLHQRQSRGGVSQKDVQQSIASRLSGETADSVGHVHNKPTSRVDAEPLGTHSFYPPSVT